MPYEVELPNGTIVEGIPDDMPRDEVRKKILSAYPDLEDYKPVINERLAENELAI